MSGQWVGPPGDPQQLQTVATGFGGVYGSLESSAGTVQQIARQAPTVWNGQGFNGFLGALQAVGSHLDQTQQALIVANTLTTKYQGTLAEAIQAFDTAQGRYDQLSAQLSALQAQLAKAQAELKRAEEALAAANAAANAAGAVFGAPACAAPPVAATASLVADIAGCNLEIAMLQAQIQQIQQQMQQQQQRMAVAMRDAEQAGLTYGANMHEAAGMVPDFPQMMSSGGGGIFGAIAGAFSDAGNWIGNATDTITGDVAQGASNFGNGIAGAFSGIYNNIKCHLDTKCAITQPTAGQQIAQNPVGSVVDTAALLLAIPTDGLSEGLASTLPAAARAASRVSDAFGTTARPASVAAGNATYTAAGQAIHVKFNGVVPSDVSVTPPWRWDYGAIGISAGAGLLGGLTRGPAPVQWGAAAGLSTAGQQYAEKGKVDPGSVAVSTGIGLAGGAADHAVTQPALKFAVSTALKGHSGAGQVALRAALPAAAKSISTASSYPHIKAPVP